MAGSKCSQTIRNITIVCLALWSVISLIIIVVWATSPDMKSANQCRAELQATTEKLEGAKVVWSKNKVALEQMVEEARQDKTRQQQEIQWLREHLGSTNVSLDDCRQENAILNGNITTLEKEIETHKELEANLTEAITLRQDHIETLQENLTQATYQTETCMALNAAAEKLKLAAESQLKGCQSRTQYVDDQLKKCKKARDNCKIVDQSASEQTAENAASPHSSILALAVFLFTSLHLITCKYNSLRCC